VRSYLLAAVCDLGDLLWLARLNLEVLLGENEVVAIGSPTNLPAIKTVAQNMSVGFSGVRHADLITETSS